MLRNLKAWNDIEWQSLKKVFQRYGLEKIRFDTNKKLYEGGEDLIIKIKLKNFPCQS